MCLSCGCGEPNERHGDDRHITADDLTQAARASNISPREAAQNILSGVQRMGGEAGWQAGWHQDATIARNPAIAFNTGL